MDDVIFKTDKCIGNKTIYYSVVWRIFFEYFESLFRSRFLVFWYRIHESIKVTSGLLLDLKKFGHFVWFSQ